MTQISRFRIFLLALFFIGSFMDAVGQDFYDIYSVKEIRLEFKQDNWEEILSRLKDQGNKKRVTATLKINGVTYDSVGVRYKGNSSYYSVKKSGSPKLPFNIKLNHKIKGQRIAGGYKTIKLSNVFRDPSFIRETLAYEVAQNYMHASKCNYARLYVNNKYMGLYNSVESVDKGFLVRHYGSKAGDLIKCDPLDIKQAINKTASAKECKPGDFAALMYQGKDSICYENNYEFKSDNAWQPLIDLTEKLNTDPENIHQLIDVDECLWMLAFNNVLVNLDSYSGKLSHNYYLYQDSLSVFHPIVWDMNMAFGGFRYSGASNKPMSNEELIDMSLFLHYKNEKRPLISKLLSEDLYRKMYVAHIKTMLNEDFKSGKYKSRAKQVQSSIDFYVKSDENRLYDYELFKKNIDETVPVGRQSIIGITELMDARAEKLLGHPLLSKIDPKVDMLMHKSTSDSTIVIQTRVDQAENVYLFYKEQGLGVTNKVLMLDTGENGDTTADDSTYSVLLPKEKVKYYFVVAEGEKTATVYPAKGSKEMKKVN